MGATILYAASSPELLCNLPKRHAGGYDECPLDTTILGAADIVLSSGKRNDTGYSQTQCEAECASNPACASFAYTAHKQECSLQPGTSGNISRTGSQPRDCCFVPLTGVDLMFLLDGSGSIELPEHGGAPGNFKNKMIAFVKKMVSESDVGDGATQVRVAVATFGGTFINYVNAPYVKVNINLAARSKAEIQVTPPFAFVRLYKAWDWSEREELCACARRAGYRCLAPPPRLQ